MRTTLPEIKSHSILYEDLEPHKGQSHNRSSTDHRGSQVRLFLFTNPRTLSNVGCMSVHYAHDQNIMRSSIIKVCVIFNISFEIFAGYYFILMEFLKPFNKLANRVLSSLKPLGLRPRGFKLDKTLLLVY